MGGGGGLIWKFRGSPGASWIKLRGTGWQAIIIMRLMISVSLGSTYLSPFINGTRNLYKKAADAACSRCCWLAGGPLSLSFLFVCCICLLVEGALV